MPVDPEEGLRSCAGAIETGYGGLGLGDTDVPTYVHEVCGSSDKPPHVPLAGTSTVSAFNEKLQVDPLF